MKCVILAAGYATRLYPLTENFPKPLLDVGGKTILDWLVDDIGDCADGFVLVSNHRFAPHFAAWAAGRKEPVAVIDDGTSSNETRLGAVRDLLLAVEQAAIEEDCLVIAGDNVLDFSLRAFIAFARRRKTSCAMRYREDDVSRLRRSGVSEIGEDDRLLGLEEKPAAPKTVWATPPFYYYTAGDLKKIPQAIADGCGTDAPGSLVAWMCVHSSMHSMEMPGKRYDIGTPESYRLVCETYRGVERSDADVK